MLARVVGQKSWISLTNRKILNKSVEIKECGDIHPFPKGPVFQADTVHLRACNKNFIYYWLDYRTFPRVKHIYLSSHPCECDVLHRFPNAKIFLVDQYRGYKERWADELNNVILMPDSEMKELAEKASDEVLVSVEL